jgi:hypothetical protein
MPINRFTIALFCVLAIAALAVVGALSERGNANAGNREVQATAEPNDDGRWDTYSVVSAKAVVDLTNALQIHDEQGRVSAMKDFQKLCGLAADAHPAISDKAKEQEANVTKRCDAVGLGWRR